MHVPCTGIVEGESIKKCEIKTAAISIVFFFFFTVLTITGSSPLIVEYVQKIM